MRNCARPVILKSRDLTDTRIAVSVRLFGWAAVWRMAGSFPAPVPFSGKPRTPEGAAVDWVALHLAPPDPAAPFVPPPWHRVAAAGPPIEFLPTRQSTRPVLLSSEEVSLYNEQGFVLRPGGGIPVLTPEEVNVHCRIWEEIFDAHCDGDPQGANGFFKRYGGAYDLVSHPVVVQLAKDILGPRCCCWGAHCVFCVFSHFVSRPSAYSFCVWVALSPVGMDD